MAREQHEQRNGVRNCLAGQADCVCVAPTQRRTRDRVFIEVSTVSARSTAVPDADKREQKERPWEYDVVVHASLDVADYLLRGRTG